MLTPLTMAQQTSGSVQGPDFVHQFQDQMKAMQQYMTTLQNHIEAMEKELAFSSSGATSDDTASEPDTDAGSLRMQSSIRSARSYGLGGQPLPLLSVTAIEGNKSFTIIMERQDISGIHQNHLMPPTKSVRSH